MKKKGGGFKSKFLLYLKCCIHFIYFHCTHISLFVHMTTSFSRERKIVFFYFGFPLRLLHPTTDMVLS